MPGQPILDPEHERRYRTLRLLAFGSSDPPSRPRVGESLGTITKKVACTACRSVPSVEELFIQRLYVLIFRDVHGANSKILRFPIPTLGQYCITLLRNGNSTSQVLLVAFLLIVRLTR